MTKEEIKELLLPAERQYQHNDCSGLLRGYDYEKVLKILSNRLENFVRQGAPQPVLLADKVILQNLIRKVIEAFRKETGVTEQLNYRENKLIELTYLQLKNNDYYVCNQDEPYAPKVIETILNGEDEKQSPNVSNDEVHPFDGQVTKSRSSGGAVAGIVWDLDDAESERSKLAGFPIFAMKCNQCFNIVGSVNNVKEITANYCSDCGARLNKKN